MIGQRFTVVPSVLAVAADSAVVGSVGGRPAAAHRPPREQVAGENPAAAGAARRFNEEFSYLSPASRVIHSREERGGRASNRDRSNRSRPDGDSFDRNPHGLDARNRNNQDLIVPDRESGDRGDRDRNRRRREGGRPDLRLWNTRNADGQDRMLSGRDDRRRDIPHRHLKNRDNRALGHQNDDQSFTGNRRNIGNNDNNQNPGDGNRMATRTRTQIRIRIRARIGTGAEAGPRTGTRRPPLPPPVTSTAASARYSASPRSPSGSAATRYPGAPRCRGSSGSSPVTPRRSRTPGRRPRPVDVHPPTASRRDTPCARPAGGRSAPRTSPAAGTVGTPTAPATGPARLPRRERTPPGGDAGGSPAPDHACVPGPARDVVRGGRLPRTTPQPDHRSQRPRRRDAGAADEVRRLPHRLGRRC